MNELALSEERLREITAPYGGPEFLNAQMERFTRAMQRLHRELPDPIEQYPDQWVAMGEDGLAATALSNEALLADLRARGIDNDALLIQFLDTSPGSLVL